MDPSNSEHGEMGGYGCGRGLGYGYAYGHGEGCGHGYGETDEDANGLGLGYGRATEHGSGLGCKGYGRRSQSDGSGHGFTRPIMPTKDGLKIGCMTRTIEEWLELAKKEPYHTIEAAARCLAAYGEKLLADKVTD